MAVIRPKDEPAVTSPAAGDKLLLDGATVRSILVDDFLSTTQPLDATLSALAALDSTAGLLTQTAADAFARRTLTGTAGEINVANGAGTAGNPTLSLPAALTLTGKTMTGGTFAGATLTASTINGLAVSGTGGGATLTIANGKTLLAANTLTLAGPDGSTITFQGTETYVGRATADTLTNKTINASNNAVSNLTTAMFAANVIDNDSALAANSSTRIPTQAAVKAYADALIAANDAMVFKGVVDCSANPNYPAADRGWTYKVSVGGKIGGASGVAVEVGDTLMCITDGTASGTQAAVGAQWNIVQANLVGAVTGPAGSTSGNIATFNGTGGTVIQDSGKALPSGAIVGISDVQALTNKTYNGNQWTVGTGTLTLGAGKTATVSNTLTFAGTDGSSVAFGAGGTAAYKGDTLAQFAATTSAQLASILSDETGSGAAVFANAPSLTNPDVTTQTAGNNTTKAASTAFVQAAVAASTAGVSSYNGRTGTVAATGTDVPLRSYLAGLTLSTAGSSATFGIAAGVATDSTNASMMSLASAATKTTGAWAVGSGNGALDTGTIANNTWYHVHLIQRPDTGVVDVLISLSATAPTLPTNYTLARRIGSMKTNGSAQWIRFSQMGDEFLWDVPVLDINFAGTTAIQVATLTVPPGLKVNALMSAAGIGPGTGAGQGRAWIFSTDTNSANALASTSNFNVGIFTSAPGSQNWGSINVRTSTAAQVYFSMEISSMSMQGITYGWIDSRGRDN